MTPPPVSSFSSVLRESLKRDRSCLDVDESPRTVKRVVLDSHAEFLTPTLFAASTLSSSSPSHEVPKVAKPVRQIDMSTIVHNDVQVIAAPQLSFPILPLPSSSVEVRNQKQVFLPRLNEFDMSFRLPTRGSYKSSPFESRFPPLPSKLSA
eukprot:GILK01001696.1.p2 GENE.GILK01001696.1~~GILK01001696.1.p2  ORF type:complete len:151 (+),score=19.18 GILK01001696.1:299-751(+)